MWGGNWVDTGLPPPRQFWDGSGRKTFPPKVTAALKQAAEELIYLRFLCSNAIALIPGREGKK